MTAWSPTLQRAILSRTDGRHKNARYPRGHMLACQPEKGALLWLGVVLHQGVVRNPDALDRQPKAVIRDEFYDRGPEAACERVFF